VDCIATHQFYFTPEKIQHIHILPQQRSPFERFRKKQLLKSCIPTTFTILSSKFVFVETSRLWSTTMQLTNVIPDHGLNWHVLHPVTFCALNSELPRLVSIPGSTTTIDLCSSTELTFPNFPNGILSQGQASIYGRLLNHRLLSHSPTICIWYHDWSTSPTTHECDLCFEMYIIPPHTARCVSHDSKFSYIIQHSKEHCPSSVKTCRPFLMKDA
jgi:hypothetical protein